MVTEDDVFRWETPEGDKVMLRHGVAKPGGEGVHWTTSAPGMKYLSPLGPRGHLMLRFVGGELVSAKTVAWGTEYWEREAAIDENTTLRDIEVWAIAVFRLMRR